MTNPDPLEVWNEACQRSQDAWYEIGEQPNDPEGDAQQRLTNQAAAAIIDQHYAPVIAEVERLREALEMALVELYAPEPNCSCHISPPCGDCVDYSSIREAADKARTALARKEQTDG